MTELFYEIVAEAPLAVNERKPGGSQFQEGLSYIPGRLVRGVLATQVLRGCQDPSHEHNHSECPQPVLCRGLFGEDLRFGDAHPLRRNIDGPFLLPATAVSCKDKSGFLGKKHGVCDTLIDRACWELLGPSAMQYAPRCPVCGGRTRSFGGAYGVANSVYCSERVARELLTRVAINRRRGVAEDEMLYAINALSQFVSLEAKDPCQEAKFETARYVGSIQFIDGGLVVPVSNQLQLITHLGGGSSRGLGRVRVAVIDPPTRLTVEDRLDRFNDMLIERWKLISHWTGGESGPPHRYFTVTLQSDAILSPSGWQPNVRLDEVMLWRACGESGQPPAELRLVRCYTTPVTRGGFQAAWGLPKQTDLAVQAGAVYLYQVNALDGWTRRMEHLEAQGVGGRLAEGFGRLRVCDPFHYEAVKEAK